MTLHVDTIEHDGWDDVYLTWVADAPVEESGVRAAFDDIATALADGRVQIVQEKIYGLCRDAHMIQEARDAALEARDLDGSLRPSFHEGAPCIGGVLAGVQIIGVVCKSKAVWVDPIQEGDRLVGRELCVPGHRMAFLAGVSGFEQTRERNVSSQTKWMFRSARTLLEVCGMRPEHLLRTWIYLPRLLDWYGEFNRVRTDCFKEFGLIGGEDDGVLPASTGIQGRRIDGEECFMDMLAVSRDDGSRPDAKPMVNVRQNEAYDYGSSFSRGMALQIGDRPTLYVSGTASIDAQGRTVHHADSQGQVLETLLDIAALLEGSRAKLSDLRHATAYCKRREDYETFRRVVALLELGHVPFVSVLADVCRDELLFEIDAIAVPTVTPDSTAERPRHRRARSEGVSMATARRSR